jgi:hypothetical protein
MHGFDPFKSVKHFITQVPRRKISINYDNH